MNEDRAALVAEQFSHAVALLRADLNSARKDREHDRELVLHRLDRLEAQAADFERRIRDLTASATQFKLLVSLSAGGGLLSIISLVRAIVR